MLSEKKLLDLIDKKGLNSKLYTHEPLSTVEESIKYRGMIEGAHSKNLFLKNKKNEFFLFSCLENTIVNIKKISKSLSLGNLSFANEHYLSLYLGVKPGAVTPFGLLNDSGNNVEFYLEEELENSADINFHPLINTMTTTISSQDLLRFIRACGHAPQTLTQ